MAIKSLDRCHQRALQLQDTAISSIYLMLLHRNTPSDCTFDCVVFTNCWNLPERYAVENMMTMHLKRQEWHGAASWLVLGEHAAKDGPNNGLGLDSCWWNTPYAIASLAFLCCCTLHRSILRKVILKLKLSPPIAAGCFAGDAVAVVRTSTGEVTSRSMRELTIGDRVSKLQNLLVGQPPCM